MPVVQLSIHAAKPADYHIELGAKLAPLRESGVLVVCSGNVVHNLRRIDWRNPESAAVWARRFDDAARQQMTEAPEEVGRLLDHPDYDLAAPTPDHFLPLLYLAGMAAADGSKPDVAVDGYFGGSISMTAFTLGAPCVAETDGPGAASLPDPSVVPPEATNI